MHNVYFEFRKLIDVSSLIEFGSIELCKCEMENDE